MQKQESRCLLGGKGKKKKKLEKKVHNVVTMR